MMHGGSVSTTAGKICTILVASRQSVPSKWGHLCSGKMAASLPERNVGKNRIRDGDSADEIRDRHRVGDVEFEFGMLRHGGLYRGLHRLRKLAQGNRKLLVPSSPPYESCGAGGAAKHSAAPYAWVRYRY